MEIFLQESSLLEVSLLIAFLTSLIVGIALAVQNTDYTPLAFGVCGVLAVFLMPQAAGLGDKILYVVAIVVSSLCSTLCWKYTEQYVRNFREVRSEVTLDLVFFIVACLGAYYLGTATGVIVALLLVGIFSTLLAHRTPLVWVALPLLVGYCTYQYTPYMFVVATLICLVGTLYGYRKWRLEAHYSSWLNR